jgi:hypothetical protein
MSTIAVLGSWWRRIPREAFWFLAGLGVTHLYYVVQQSDAQAEAEDQRRMMDLVLRGVESVGNIKFLRDTSGKVVSVSIELRGQAISQSTATGSLTAEPVSAPSK